MKISFILRVIIISPEMVILMAMVAALILFTNETTAFIAAVNLHEDLVKYLAVIPAGLFVWSCLSAKELVHGDPEISRILVNWTGEHGYVGLVTTIYISIFYAFLFMILSIIPWLVPGGIKSGIGFIFFIASLTGSLCVAACIYFAGFSARAKCKTEHSK